MFILLSLNHCQFTSIFLISESCSEVKCDVGEKCVERNGRPKCVCAPDCRGSAKRTLPKHVAGKPVCGTDGKSYRTLCRLKKRACRRKNSSLTVAYYGPCQSTYIFVTFYHI